MIAHGPASGMDRSSCSGAKRAQPPPTFVARAFGRDIGDLAVRIDPQRPVESIDALLAGCLLDDADAPLASPRQLRGWPVARRLDALIAIRMAGGVATESVSLLCPACDETMEIGLDLAACRPTETPDRIAFDVDGRGFEARCPTGADHARWQAERPPLGLIASQLLETEAALDDSVMTSLEAALIRHDPGRELAVSTTCPSCHSAVETTIALETRLLQAFAAEQRDLLREIAAISRIYPWSEAEVTAMPAWRRRFYLAHAAASEAVR